MTNRSTIANTTADRRARRLALRLILVVSAVSALSSAGCREDDEITRYTAPKTSKVPPPARARLLAAIFPRAEDTWFFKFTGPAAAVDKCATDFDGFIRSVRFTGKDNPPVEWTVPVNWRKGPESTSRYATFFAGSENNATELSVTKLGKNAGSLLANVNRWRQQMGLIELAVFELGSVTRSSSINGVNVTWVDMSAAGK